MEHTKTPENRAQQGTQSYELTIENLKKYCEALDLHYEIEYPQTVLKVDWTPEQRQRRIDMGLTYYWKKETFDEIVFGFQRKDKKAWIWHRTWVINEGVNDFDQMELFYNQTYFGGSGTKLRRYRDSMKTQEHMNEILNK